MANRLLRSEQGFTLFEVIIAMSIMVLAFASILAVESNSINATTRAKEMNIVAMLARNQMTELEYKVEGKTFDEVKKEEGGQFTAPYEGYRWKTEVKELEFPNLSVGGGAGASQSASGDSKAEGSSDSASGNQFAEQITRLVTNYFSKAVRELNVTIFWQRGGGEVSYTVSTYWVDLNHEFKTTE